MADAATRGAAGPSAARAHPARHVRGRATLDRGDHGSTLAEDPPKIAAGRRRDGLLAGWGGRRVAAGGLYGSTVFAADNRARQRRGFCPDAHAPAASTGWHSWPGRQDH